MQALLDAMGKRGETRPDISKDVQDAVLRARAALGKAKPAPARPLATPTRASGAPPIPDTEAVSTPAQKTGTSGTPMSVQSTPVKSPDLKKFRSVESIGSDKSSESSAVPPLPSFTSDRSSLPRNPDSSTTLGLTDYFMSTLNLQGPNFELRCRYMSLKFKDQNPEGQNSQSLENIDEARNPNPLLYMPSRPYAGAGAMRSLPRFLWLRPDSKGTAWDL